MNEVISIIIPVYNVKKYLPCCLDSITAQTYKNLEILLIDDGSTDGSGALCDEYAAADSRIRVLHKENGGVSAARNLGLEKATGEYIGFVDADDYVDENYIGYMYALAEEHNADVVCVGSETVFDGKSARSAAAERVEILDSTAALRDLLTAGKIAQAPWGKLFCAELLRETRFPEGVVLAEDFYVNCRCLLGAKTVVCSDKPLYKYQIRSGSAVQSDFNRKKYSEIEMVEKITKEIEAERAELAEECNNRRVFSYCKVLHRILSSKNRGKYQPEQAELQSKIKASAEAVLQSAKANNSLKIKVQSLKIGKPVFQLAYNISDIAKQIKAGHRYTV